MSVAGMVSFRSLVLLDGQSQPVDLMFLLLSPDISIVTLCDGQINSVDLWSQ